MPFCTHSRDSLNNSYTVLDNIFVTDYLPDADDAAVKVYLYGLLQCTDYSSGGNSIENMSITLGLTANEIDKAVRYWDSLGVVHITSESPLTYEYLPLKNVYRSKKYNREKYSDFVSQLESMILGRAMTPNEIMKYVETIEEYKLEPEAMLMAVDYCIKHKGNNINTNYILTVAKAWANEGANTVAKVEQKLKELESNSDDMRQIYYALGLKSSPDYEDKQMYVKWRDSWGYSLESILYTAKLCKRRGGMRKLDSMLDEFFRKGIYTLSDIKGHAKYIEYTRNLTVNINKKLGVYYENIDPVIEGYTIPWLERGFDGKGLLIVASFCFARTIKTLEGMNNLLDKMYNMGVVSNDAIDEYLKNITETDKRIKEILSSLGSSRNVCQSDRDYYTVWTEKWGFDRDIIYLACSLSSGASHSLAYVNRLLADWQNAGLKTVEECRAYGGRQVDINAKPQAKHPHDLSGQHTYSKEELDSIYENMEKTLSEFGL